MQKPFKGKKARWKISGCREHAGFENPCLTCIPLPANPQWLPIFGQLPQITSVYSRPRNTKNSGWKTGKWHIWALGFPVSNPFSQSLGKNTKIPQCFASYKHDSCFDTEIPSLSEWKIVPLRKWKHVFSPNYHLFYTCYFKNKFLLKKNNVSNNSLRMAFTHRAVFHVQRRQSQNSSREGKTKIFQRWKVKKIPYPGINEGWYSILITTEHKTQHG